MKACDRCSTKEKGVVTALLSFDEASVSRPPGLSPRQGTVLNRQQATLCYDCAAELDKIGRDFFKRDSVTR